MDQETIIRKLKEIQEDKSVDDIAALFLSVVSLYGLDMSEVASISYYLFDRTIKEKHNESFIKDKFGIDINELGVDGIQTLQKALLASYIEKVK